MKFFVISLLLSLNISFAQTLYETIESEVLGTSRELKIQLPRNYEDNPEQSYPLIVVFDGDYLFEVVAGNVDYYSYWGDMPEAIVVGVNQVDSKDQDYMMSLKDYLPSKTGAQFYDFIENELIIFMNENYRSLNFRMAVGHGKSANFINYFMFNTSPVFNAYVALSPSLSYNMEENLTRRLGMESKAKTFYYLATATLDFKQNKNEAIALNSKISALENSTFLYAYDNFEDATHYSLVAQAIPKALQNIFIVFQPISMKEYKDYILPSEDSPVAYLIEKYDMIESLFGIEKQILVNDFRAIAAAIENTEQFELYRDLAKLANTHYPDSTIASYYLARHYEELGRLKKAMNIYYSAYMLDDIEGYSKDDMLERADEIKTEYGY